MKAIYLSFNLMLKYIKKDKMQLIICLAPILIGLVFRFGIPLAESLLTKGLNQVEILAPYYKLFDIFFAMISPTLFCLVSAFVSLEEVDEKTTAYLFTTPLRKNGYLFSRLGIPLILAFIITLILLPIINLSPLSIMEIILLPIMGAFQGLIVSLTILAFSTNKLEGLALSKLSSIIVVGAIIPFFIKNNVKYLFSFLPSFWIGVAIEGSKLIYMIVSFILSIIWIYILIKKYNKKL